MSPKRLLFSLLLGITSLSQNALADVSFQAKALLSGAYQASTGLMRDDLRVKGYIPTQQPYNTAPFNYAGTETVSSTQLATTGNTALVDWVLVELRDKSDNSLVGAQKAVLIQRDGMLFDPTTNSNTIVFKGFEPDYYRVSIDHRMHLGVTTPPALLSENLSSIDFTSLNIPTEGEAARQTSGQVALLWSGDIDANNSVISVGQNNDRNHLAASVLLASGNTSYNMNYRLNGYYNSDLNMDGSTVVSGPNNDLNIIDGTILQHPLNSQTNTNYIITGKLPVGKFDYVGQAVRTGDLSTQATETDLLTKFYNTIDEAVAKKQKIQQDIFKLNSDGSLNANSITNLSWDLSYESVSFDMSSIGMSFPIIAGNAAVKNNNISINRILGFAGIRPNQAHYAVLGGNLLHDLKRTTELGGTANSNMNLFAKSLINWLTQKDDFALYNSKIVVAQIADGYWKQDATTRNWLVQNYPKASINAADSCDNSYLAACLQGTDLLVLSRDEGKDDNHGIPFNLDETMAAVKEAQNQGIPILYLHYDGASNNLSNALMLYFGATSADNYWRQEMLSAYDPSTFYSWDFGNLLVFKQTVQSINNANLDFDYTSTNCTNYVGTTTCNAASVLDKKTGVTLEKLFTNGAVSLRKILNDLDLKGKNVFSLDSGYNIIKLATLLGDKYRNTIVYPMDKLTTPDHQFLKAIFSDFTVSYKRTNNNAQINMGDFTKNQDIISNLVGQNKTFVYKPTAASEWTSTGFYAPPGRTITVRRTDNTATTVRIRFNFLRDATTRYWNTNSYSRPIYMSTPTNMVIPAGTTQTFSTPYGGPIYIGWDGVSSTPENFTLEFENIATHPKLESFDDASIQTYLTELENTPFNWTDIKTPYAEIHSLKPYMFTAFSQYDGNKTNGYTVEDVKKFIADLNKYLIAGNYSYAGFQGVGLPELNTEVTNFCTERGFDQALYDGVTKNLCTDSSIHAKPNTQHINSDINAQCGALCSGNPFDSYAPINPFGWGENHEMGHNLQRGRLKIYDGRSSEVSNNIFPLHTSWISALDKNLATGDTSTPPHKDAYKIIQDAIAANIAPSIDHPLWVGSGVYDNAFQRLSFYIQLIYSQQSWDFYTKLYIMERIFNDAIKTDTKWASAKNLLGMGNYTRTTASSISSNDFMYLGASFIGRKNYSNYFEKWGIAVSQTAKDQVTANGVTEQAPAVMYYVSGNIPVTMPTIADTLPLDGVTLWADPTP